MDRTLKTLFAFVLILLLILPVVNCKKGGGDDDNGIKYTEANRQISYQRIVPLGYHEMDSEVWIKVTLNCPIVPNNGTFYLRVSDGSLSQVDSDVFIGFIPQRMAIGKVHTAFVHDVALPRMSGINVNCSIYTFRGLFLEWMEIVRTISWSGCPPDSPGGILYFKITQ